MTKKKIALVVVRYGEGIDGGGEAHCRMLASHLMSIYHIEILTTCIKNYSTGLNEFEEGVTIEDGVITRRFWAKPIGGENRDELSEKNKIGRKIRRNLFRLKLLKPISLIKPIWTLNEKNEIAYMKGNFFYSSNLFSFINENKDDYHAFIFITYAYPLVVFGIENISEKTIFIPTAHNESMLFLSIYTKIFNNVKHIAFNTVAEQQLCKNVFGKALSNNSVIGIGIESKSADDWEKVKNKYNLPEEYVLYLGRVDEGKINNLISMFQSYKEKYPSSMKLVLTGGIHMDVVKEEDIVYTGFVSEEEKTSIIQNATVIINPSKYESLSLILLEAMWLKKPLLVNGKCKVLKDHCKLSDGAAFYYLNKKQFIERLHKIVSSKELQSEMGLKGQKYVGENYNWDIIVNKFRTIIESI